MALDPTLAGEARIAAVTQQGRARIPIDPEEDARARSLLHDKYAPRYGGSLDDWRDTALPVAVDFA